MINNTKNCTSPFAFNNKSINLIAGPCSAESEEQLLTTARGLHALGINTLRAGIWKPRSRANHFEGVGEIGLQWLQKVQKELGMKVTTEVGSVRHVELALKYGIDIFWIGARTTVNPFLIQDIAEALQGTDVPVMVKNPVCPDVELWRGAVERLLSCNVKIQALIHRGVCLPDSSPYRNAPLWEMAQQMRKVFPDLPMYCDPSHICGKRNLLADVATTALTAGMDGLFIESHCNPDNALSDALQQVCPADLGLLLDEIGVRRPR